MEKTVWKVVAATMVDDQEVWTSLLQGILGDAMCYYRPGRITKPTIPGSYLYAFNDQKIAEESARISNLHTTGLLRYQVWEATADVVQVAKPSQAQFKFREFWAENRFGLDYEHDDVTEDHDSTVWCYSIALEEMIWGSHPQAPKPKGKAAESMSKFPARRPLTVHR